MKKVVAILLTLTTLFTLSTLTGCRGPIDNDQAIEILTPLLEKDAQLNRYVWGDGFTTLEDPGEDADITDYCQYYRVNADAPYHSVEALKAEIDGLYSTLLAAAINEYAFSNTDDSMARFCDYTENKTVIDLQIDVTLNHPPYSLKTVIYPATAVVKRSTMTIIEAEVEYSVGAEGERDTMTIRALKQDGVWKLDTHTWAGEVAN